jgi:hypothetical protein
MAATPKICGKRRTPKNSTPLALTSTELTRVSAEAFRSAARATLKGDAVEARARSKRAHVLLKAARRVG